MAKVIANLMMSWIRVEAAANLRRMQINKNRQRVPSNVIRIIAHCLNNQTFQTCLKRTRDSSLSIQMAHALMHTSVRRRERRPMRNKTVGYRWKADIQLSRLLVAKGNQRILARFRLFKLKMSYRFSWTTWSTWWSQTKQSKTTSK